MHAGKDIEVMAQDNIVEEVMNSDSKSAVNYCDDASKKKGIGSFTVQGTIINDRFRALSILVIASESRFNLRTLNWSL